jgi:hypothetical protein
MPFDPSALPPPVLDAERYRQARVNPSRVVIEVTVDRVLGAASLGRATA